MQALRELLDRAYKALEAGHLDDARQRIEDAMRMLEEDEESYPRPDGKGHHLSEDQGQYVLDGDYYKDKALSCKHCWEEVTDSYDACPLCGATRHIVNPRSHHADTFGGPR